MYGTELRYNDLRYNDIPYITMSFWRTERKIFPDITILQYQHTVEFKQNIESITLQLSTTAICNVSVNSFQFTMPLCPPCHLRVLSVLVFLNERKREFLSSLSAMN